MKVIVHFPKTINGKENLEKAVTDVHINAVLKYVSELNCSKEQKEKLLKEVAKND